MSEFLERKVRTYFKHTDINNDGYVSLKDFLEVAGRLADTAKFDDAERRNLNESCVKLWRKYMKSAESDDNGLLTPSILLESVKQQKDDPEFKEALLATYYHAFALLGVNGDGLIQEDQYTSAVADMGFKDTNIVQRVFEATRPNINLDGKLTWEEFGNAIYENLTSEDENSPYAWVLGPLD